MPRRMIFFVPAILIVALASTLATAQTSVAEPAADECKTKPDSQPLVLPRQSYESAALLVSRTGRQEGAFASTGRHIASARECSRNDSHDACTNGARTKDSCRGSPTTGGGSRLCLAHVRAPESS